MTAGQASATVQLMRLDASGKHATIGARYPRAEALSRSAMASSSLLPRWPLLLALLAFLVLSTGGVAVARQGKAARQAAIEASIRLSKALEAGCR